MSKNCKVADCGRIGNHKGLCAAHALRLRNYGDTFPDRPIVTKRPRGMSPEQVYEYFLPEQRGDSCWEWQGVIAKIGYGQVVVNGRAVYGHRLAWEVTHGEIPEGMQVRHSCDNRKCVNPKHLSLGTFYDNMQDAIDRRRFRHSENHWNAKLDSETVKEIRKLADSGQKHQSIADKFGITRSAVTNIANRKSWTSVS